MAANGTASATGVHPASAAATRTSVSAGANTTVVAAADEEEAGVGCLGTCCPRIDVASLRRPVEIEYLSRAEAAFSKWPILGPLLFPNESSDARDHCANERTFLSYLRLSAYMAVVSMAIALSFHLKSQPTQLELRMAKPLGGVFWGLSVSCLAAGLANYIRTINKYSRKSAIVQTGWKTQVIMGAISLAIVGTCIALLVITGIDRD